MIKKPKRMNFAARELKSKGLNRVEPVVETCMTIPPKRMAPPKR